MTITKILSCCRHIGAKVKSLIANIEHAYKVSQANYVKKGVIDNAAMLQEGLRHCAKRQLPEVIKKLGKDILESNLDANDFKGFVFKNYSEIDGKYFQLEEINELKFKHDMPVVHTASIELTQECFFPKNIKKVKAALNRCLDSNYKTAYETNRDVYNEFSEKYQQDNEVICQEACFKDFHHPYNQEEMYIEFNNNIMRNEQKNMRNYQKTMNDKGLFWNNCRIGIYVLDIIQTRTGCFRLELIFIIENKNKEYDFERWYVKQRNEVIQNELF